MFSKILLFVLFFSLPYIAYGNSFSSTKVLWLKIQYIQYDVWSDDYTLKVAINKDATTLTSLARDYNGISGINWAFFCPADYSACWWVSHTINERIVNGEDLSFYTDTGERAIFGWTGSGSPLFHQTKNINSDVREDFHWGLWNFPIIFSEWKNMIEIYHDNGLYDSKMKAPLPRHFICSNKEKTWIRFWRTHSTSLDALAPVLYELWCWNALNLDAWNSSKFMYNGKDILWSGRDILDAVVVERKWIDVFQIESNIDSIMRRLSPQFKRLRKTNAIGQLKSIMNHINILREQIYTQNTSDILDDSGNLNWYTINVGDLKDLKHVYSLNILEKKINHLLWEIKN